MSGVVLLVLRLVSAAILYAFIGWAFYLLWRDLKQQSDSFKFLQIPSISLQLEEDGHNEPHLFHQAEIMVGRDPTCDFPIEDALVSAHHAQLTFHHAQWWAEDMQSKNGTLLNENLIDIPTVIVSGDILLCGKSKVFIKIG